MKNIFTLALLFVLHLQGTSQSITLDWVTQINSNNSAITGSAIRENGDILVRGFYKDYLAIENDTVIDISDPSQDSYLLQVTANGQLDWSRRFDYTTGEVYHRIASKENHIYNQGFLLTAPTSFDMTTIQSLSIGSNDSLFTIPGQDLCTDIEGNVYTTGSFDDSYDFDPSTDQEMILTALNSIDTYLSKYDKNQNLLWARSFPGQSAEAGSVVSLDNENNVYMAANFRDSVDVDLSVPGFELPNDDSQNDSYFLSKLSSTGDLLWYKPINGIGRKTIRSVAFDNNNNAIIVGGFRDELIYEIAGVSYTLTSQGDEDIYVAKIDPMGNYLWVNAIGGLLDQYGLSLEIDDDGYVFVMGSYYGEVKFDPNSDDTNVSAGFSDSFIQIYDNDGNYFTHYTYGGAGFDWGRSIHLDDNNDLILISAAGSSIDVDLSDAVYNITPSGTRSSFVAKYSICKPSSLLQIYGICEGDILTLNGIDYDSEGIYAQTLQDSNLCDYTLNLVITTFNIAENFISESICEGDTLLGYSTEGEYEIFDIGQNGCDSITTLSLTILSESDPLCMTTNVVDRKNLIPITISPNPLTDKCTFDSDRDVEQVIIYDINGNIVFQSYQISNNQISTERLAPGIYIFKIMDKQSTSSQRVVKL